MGRLVLVLLVMVLASRETRTRTTAGRTPDDVLITAEVKTKSVMDQTASRWPKITAATTDGTVALNGNVESAAAKH
jgi:osmotically-inducible protein OsmY